MPGGAILCSARQRRVGTWLAGWDWLITRGKAVSENVQRLLGGLVTTLVNRTVGSAGCKRVVLVTTINCCRK
jgi:hypothetical protein